MLCVYTMYLSKIFEMKKIALNFLVFWAIQIIFDILEVFLHPFLHTNIHSYIKLEVFGLKTSVLAYKYTFIH